MVRTSNLLLPCPFCGQPDPRLYQSGGYWKIKCVDGCSITINGSSNRASVVDVWNRRPVDGVGELVEAAEKVYQLRDAMHANGPSALIIALAMIDLHKATEKVRQGSASNPPDVGN